MWKAKYGPDNEIPADERAGHRAPLARLFGNGLQFRITERHFRIEAHRHRFGEAERIRSTKYAPEQTAAWLLNCQGSFFADHSPG